MIECVVIEDAEVITSGADGYIKVWDLATLDQADRPSPESNIFVLEPQYERKIGGDVHVKVSAHDCSALASDPMQCLAKSNEVGDDDIENIWYAQDQKGAVWRVEVSNTQAATPAERVLSFHAGEVTGLDRCPTAHIMATTGADGSVRVFDYEHRKLLASIRQDLAGTSLAWAPHNVSTSL